MDLSQQEWAERVAHDNNSIILDVRTNDEFDSGYIPTALHNDIYKAQAFIYKLEELDKNINYYVYCKAGGRSAQACSIMQQLGFKNTYNLVGGIMNWQGAIDHP